MRSDDVLQRRGRPGRVRRFTQPRRAGAILAAAIAFAATAAPAQTAGEYPAKPVRLVVPFPPGGISDVLARALGVRLGEAMGQPFVVENRPGAGTVIAADFVAKAPPDGYVLMVQDITTHAINPALAPKLPFDSLRDFTPVAPIAGSPLMLVVRPDAPTKTVEELAQQGRSRGAALAYGSSGNGTLPHLVGEAFKRRTAGDWTHVPYKGQTAQYVLTGEVAWTFSVMPPAVAAMKAGRLKALAVTSPRRVDAAPDVPTMSELGFAGFEFTLVSGVLAPAGLPAGVLARLNDEIARAVRGSGMHATLAAIGAEPLVASPERFAAQLRADTERLGAVVREAGIRAD